MAYLNMNARITIGQVVFENINSFSIEESVKELSDSATIVLAKNYRQLAGNTVLNLIGAGQKVTIECGYNGEYFVEYEGYVKPGISSEFPIVVECDQMLKLRQNNWVKSYRTVTLKNLLQDVAPGYTIECPDTNLGKMIINNASTYQVLNELKDKYGFFSKIYGTVLHVGWPFDYTSSRTKNHEYTIGKNVKSARGLKYRTEIDFNTTVVVSINLPDGKKKDVKAGSKGSDAKTVKLSMPHITEAEAKRIADAHLKKVLYEGYEGNIDGFAIPRTRAGDSITIINEKIPEREGTYLVEKVTIEYAESHITRTNSLSFKV